MNLLALDQAGQCGWCVWADGVYHHGVWRLDKIKNQGGRYLQFARNLRALHNEHGLDYVGYEDPFLGGAETSARTVEATMAWPALIKTFCASVRLPDPLAFRTASWRKTVYGEGKAYPPKKPPMTPAQRKAWHLGHAFDLCADLGLEVKDGNAAEAVGILEALRAEVSPAYATENRVRVTGQGALL